MNRIFRKLKSTLKRLPRSAQANQNSGYCPICGAPAIFTIEGPWLRDEYLCEKCRSIPRWRALMHVLDQLRPDWRQLAIHESSPCGPLSEKLAKECPAYLPTQFFPGVPKGQMNKGFRCEDLLAQTFGNESFDLVITSDVFEHLPEVAPAVREIMRTLRPGGAHVFTVPWYKTKKTLTRARMVNGKLEHLEKPDYHGNPVDASGSLVFNEWGMELPFWLGEWGKSPVVIHTILDRNLGIDGEFREVFVQEKPGSGIYAGI